MCYNLSMFYNSIADNYDLIFPQNKKQLEFIEKIRAISPGEEIIDIGCATGNLTKLLHDKSRKTTGLDMDEDLLKLAKKKYCHIFFDNMNMMDIDVANPKNSVDRVVSFGNTLVHLKSRRHVKQFFKKCYTVMKNDALLIFQIINYDRIIDQNITSLPTIKNKEITFIRDYNLIEDNSKVEFNTKLITKNGEELENSINLLALREEEIKEYLLEANFKDISFYGDLDGGKVTKESIPLIFTCVK